MISVTAKAGDTNTPLLSLQNLHAWFSTASGLMRAVDGVSLDIAPGEKLGVLGESGSGKTQTFHSVFGLGRGAPGVVRGSARFADVELLADLDQHVRVDYSETGAPLAANKDTVRWRAVHQQRLAPLMGREVAMLFQDPRRSLIPYWTIGQHLDNALARRSANGAATQSSAELLRSLGFSTPARILDSYPQRLSGGEAQRAMLALTMAMKPKLLIADEPTTGLDTINQTRVLAALRELQANSSMAMVLISHDLAVVESVVDRVVVMYGGKVLAAAPVSALEQSDDASLHPYLNELRDSQRRRSYGAQIKPSTSSEVAGRQASGCSFRNRCMLRPQLPTNVQAQCATEVPPLVTLGGGRSSACWGVTS